LKREYPEPWSITSLPPLDLTMLAYPFTKDEIWNIIKEIPVDKSPRLDGFARCFYKTAWPIIKHDVIRVLNMLAQLDSRSFHHLNNSLMIPKKQEPTMLNGNRSISLINSFSELFSKALADCLAVPLKLMVRHNQSAFIKNRHIQDNFRYIQAAAKILHGEHIPSLHIKLDITKAFVSVMGLPPRPFSNSWAFLGFPSVWTNWITKH